MRMMGSGHLLVLIMVRQRQLVIGQQVRRGHVIRLARLAAGSRRPGTGLRLRSGDVVDRAGVRLVMVRRRIGLGLGFERGRVVLVVVTGRRPSVNLTHALAEATRDTDRQLAMT